MNIKEITIRVIEDLNFNNIFLIDMVDGIEYNYNAFFSRCLILAEKFSKLSNHNIFVVYDNSVELLAIYFATILANKRIIVADPEKGQEEIELLLAEQIDVFPIIAKSGLECNLSVIDWFTNVDVFDNSKVKEIVLEKLKNYNFDDDYLTTFTSGTSGKTKGVVNSLNNLFGTTFAFIEKLDIPNNGTFFHLMPMTYMAGILNSIFMPFILGYRIVVASRFSVKTAFSFWKTVEKYGVNLLWMSPMMLMMVNQVDRGKKYEEYCKVHDICFLIGTAPLHEDLRKNFEKRYGVMLQASYGLSETLFLSVETKASILEKKRDNVGELLSGVECKVLDDGELHVYVPWMFKGYTNVAEEEYFSGKYYMTGDLVEINNGVLSIVGRKKDLIIRGGMNISPKIVEDCVLENDKISECCVFGKKNRYGEEEVWCAYVSKEEDALLIKELEKEVSLFVLNKLGNNYSVNGFIKMKALPRNINGKIDKKMLQG